MVRRWLLLCSILCVLWPEGRTEVVLGKETDEFDFDGLPGAMHEFKYEVGAGKEECFYQMVKQGGKIHLSFEVLKGGDELLDSVNIRLPSMEIFEETRTKTRWVFEVDTPVAGSYAICLDNSYSMMHSKLVYLYFVTYVEREWDEFKQEIEDLHLTVANFTNSLHMVTESIQAATQHQAEMRLHIVKDWYLILGNNVYIQRWSILQCIVIVGSTCTQVYFVRRLFRTVNVTPSKKPRA